MAISATIVDIRGEVFPEVYEELLFETKTINKKLVNLDDGFKANAIFTESTATATMQAYTSGVPTSSGTLAFTDVILTPVKVMFYQEYDPNSIRSSRFNTTMKKGAWNIESSEFNQTVVNLYNKKVAYTTEAKFWNNIKSATQTAIAALTPGAGQGSVGAAEQTYAAALTAGQFDGVVTTMIYNNGGLGTRIKVAGTTVSASNIKTEMDKIYAAIPAVVLNQSSSKPVIYVPYSWMQYINQYNNVATNFKDVFVVSGLGTANETITFQGLRVETVPLPENCAIAAKPEYINWLTDSMDDINMIKAGYAYLNADTQFIKHVFTIYAHVANQSYNVLYLG